MDKIRILPCLIKMCATKTQIKSLKHRLVNVGILIDFIYNIK